MINQNAKQAEFFAKRIEELLIEIYSSFIINQEIKDKTIIENVILFLIFKLQFKNFTKSLPPLMNLSLLNILAEKLPNFVLNFMNKLLNDEKKKNFN